MQGRQLDAVDAFWNTQEVEPEPEVSTESLIARLSGRTENYIVSKSEIAEDSDYKPTESFKDFADKDDDTGADNKSHAKNINDKKPTLREQLAARTASIPTEPDMIAVDPSDFAVTDMFREDTPITKTMQNNFLFQVEPTEAEIKAIQHRIDAEPYEYLRKILNGMHPLNKDVYYSQTDQFGKPNSFDTLLVCMAALRERVAVIPVSMRNAVFACIFTKYVDIAVARGMDANKLYKHFYDCLPKISEHSKFLPALQDKLTKQLEHSGKRVKQCKYEMEFSIRCVIHFLNSVSR